MTHPTCPKCNNAIEVRDGKEIGGIPGISYDCCNACGWNRAKTTKETKQDKLRRLK